MSTDSIIVDNIKYNYGDIQAIKYTKKGSGLDI